MQAGCNAPLHIALNTAIVSLDLSCGFLSSMTVQVARLRPHAPIGYATKIEAVQAV